MEDALKGGSYVRHQCKKALYKITLHEDVKGRQCVLFSEQCCVICGKRWAEDAAIVALVALALRVLTRAATRRQVLRIPDIRVHDRSGVLLQGETRDQRRLVMEDALKGGSYVRHQCKKALYKITLHEDVKGRQIICEKYIRCCIYSSLQFRCGVNLRLIPVLVEQCCVICGKRWAEDAAIVALVALALRVLTRAATRRQVLRIPDIRVHDRSGVLLQGETRDQRRLVMEDALKGGSYVRHQCKKALYKITLHEDVKGRQIICEKYIRCCIYSSLQFRCGVNLRLIPVLVEQCCVICGKRWAEDAAIVALVALALRVLTRAATRRQVLRIPDIRVHDRSGVLLQGETRDQRRLVMEDALKGGSYVRHQCKKALYKITLHEDVKGRQIAKVLQKTGGSPSPNINYLLTDLIELIRRCQYSNKHIKVIWIRGH
ncbi:unnamed protein product, partial [Callosobruchus maculatus]